MTDGEQIFGAVDVLEDLRRAATEDRHISWTPSGPPWDPRLVRGRAFVLLVAGAFSSAVGMACSTGSAKAPVTTTSLGTSGPAPETGVQQRCTVIFQTPTSGQTSARRTVISIETGEEVAVFEAGEEMPPLEEIAGCEPE